MKGLKKVLAFAVAAIMTVSTFGAAVVFAEGESLAAAVNSAQTTSEIKAALKTAMEGGLALDKNYTKVDSAKLEGVFGELLNYPSSFATDQEVANAFSVAVSKNYNRAIVETHSFDDPIMGEFSNETALSNGSFVTDTTYGTYFKPSDYGVVSQVALENALSGDRYIDIYVNAYTSVQGKNEGGRRDAATVYLSNLKGNTGSSNAVRLFAPIGNSGCKSKGFNVMSQPDGASTQVSGGTHTTPGWNTEKTFVTIEDGKNTMMTMDLNGTAVKWGQATGNTTDAGLALLEQAPYDYPFGYGQSGKGGDKISDLQYIIYKYYSADSFDYMKNFKVTVYYSLHELVENATSPEEVAGYFDFYKGIIKGIPERTSGVDYDAVYTKLASETFENDAAIIARYKALCEDANYADSFKIRGANNISIGYGEVSATEQYAVKKYWDNSPATVTSWSVSGDSSVISIDATGKLTINAGITTGTYTITAVTESGTLTFDVAVSAGQYSLEITGESTVYIAGAGTSTYNARVIDEKSSVVDTPGASSVVWSVSPSSDAVSISDGVLSLTLPAPETVTITAEYNGFVAEKTVTVKEMIYTLNGPTSAVRPEGEVITYVAFQLMGSDGKKANNAVWTCTGSEILSDGRLLLQSETADSVVVTAELDGLKYTATVKVTDGSSDGYDVFDRQVVYTGSNSMTVASSGVSEKKLSAKVVDESVDNLTVAVSKWEVAGYGDDYVGNTGDVYVSGNKLYARAGASGTVYVKGYADGSLVNTGEVAIVLHEAISSFDGTKVSATGEPSATYTINVYNPADGDYIARMIGYKNTDPTVLSMTADANGYAEKTLTYGDDGMYLIEVSDTNGSVDEYEYTKGTDKLFKQNNVEEMLKNDNADDILAYFVTYTSLDKATADECIDLYKATANENMSNIIEYTDEDSKNFLAAVYLVAVLEGKTDYEVKCATELEKLGYKAGVIEKFADRTDFDTLRAGILGDSTIDTIAEVLKEMTTTVVLDGVAASGSYYKLALPYLALLGNTKYDDASDYGKELIADAVNGNTYPSLTALNDAIDKVNISGDKGVTQGGLGGYVSPGPSTVVVSPIPDVNTDPAGTFPDVLTTYWGYKPIEELAARGILEGYNNGYFYPENSVTRAEFVKILVSGFDLSLTSNKYFEDVAEGDWHYSYVSTAYEYGIILGSDGKFNPDENITRQDAAVILHRFMNKQGIDIPDYNQVEFSDDNSIADYAKESVYALADAGIINGVGGGMFAPTEATNRAAAAKLIYNIMTIGGLI